MHRKDTQGHIVLPIFYHVDPSDVRNLGGSFKKSFNGHGSNRLPQVQRWKTAFAEVGKLKGWHIEGGKFDRPETEYIKDIIEYVIKKLMSGKFKSASAELVGIDDQKQTILRLIEQEESRLIGLWGQGGIGKTTLSDGTDLIQGIKLDMSQVENLQLHYSTFEGMMNLRVLLFYTPRVFDVKCLTNKFLAHQVDSVSLPDELREIDISYCKNLRKIPSLLGAINLEILDCRSCECLVELPCLNHLASLKPLELRGCRNLKKLPQIPNHFPILSLEESEIEEVPDSIEHLIRLKGLILWNSKKSQKI
ncbi:TMV resistance N [Gossypium arboreum]|uniref:TMV resistance N n=1 Tax=Gossypium arboreum TaxID=29729 RepID=A0A0B0NH09_GOSAR|nr:TMV resistance N [Gossypium arboreum]